MEIRKSGISDAEKKHRVILILQEIERVLFDDEKGHGIPKRGIFWSDKVKVGFCIYSTHSIFDTLIQFLGSKKT